MITSILFDFDGTLANTTPGIVKTMQETFRAMNLPIPSEDAIRQSIGIPLKKALQMVGNLSDEIAETVRIVYSSLFMTYEIGNTAIYPQVKETLAYLKDRGIRMAIVTSRNIESLDILLDRNDIRKYFEMMVTNNDGIKPKPAPDMVRALLERMQISNNETLVIGDTTYDIEMGNAAQCRTCAVTYGNHSREQLMTANPDFVIDGFKELLQLFDS